MYLYHIQVFTPVDKLTTSHLFREEFIEEVEFHTYIFFLIGKRRKSHITLQPTQLIFSYIFFVFSYTYK